MKLAATIQNIVGNRPLQHAMFWAFSFYILMRFFAYSDEISKVDIIYTFLFHLSILAAVYPNLLWLIPRFLRIGKYALYFIFLAMVLLLAIGLNLLTFNYLCDILFPGYYFIAYYGFWQILQFITAYIVITTLLKLSKGWFQYLETQRKLTHLEKEKSEAELSALKAQVNPHFLFNSLNNLYSLSLDNDGRTPELILRLSQMMRYILYESNVAFVPLEKELEHLLNFVEMQKIRAGEQVKIKLNMEGNPDGKMIAPLLFLPLLENGFKHGVKGDTENAFIKINLQILDNQVVLKTENNKGTVDEVEKGHFKGVGLQNLRRRLELIYPGQYKYEIMDGISVYSAVLTIKI